MKIRNMLVLSFVCFTLSCKGPILHEQVILLPATPPHFQITSANQLAKALEERWSLSRIEELVEGTAALNGKGKQGLKLDPDDWQGDLHEGQKRLSRIYFCAFVTNGAPTHFAIFVTKKERTWNIEAGELSSIFQSRTIVLAGNGMSSKGR